MSLLNPLLIRTGILQDVSKPPPQIPWFKGVSLSFLMINVLVPLIITMIIAFFLKQRYVNKQQRLNLDLTIDDDNSGSSWTE